jgi:hypothetical protein
MSVISSYPLLRPPSKAFDLPASFRCDAYAVSSEADELVTGTLRAERLAKNEAMFRAANEATSGWEEQHRSSEPELYYCECSEVECREKVSLEKSDYERVRSDARHFFVVPGHEITDIETVIEQHEGWVIVEKPPEVSETVERLHPRRAS